MTIMPDLRTALLDLLYETRGDDLKLIIGGGYGIFLKREHVRQSGARTLLTEWPEARSTNDLDLFLRPELLVNATRVKPLAAALQTLGYEVIPGAEKYQFAKPGPTGSRQGSLKVDLLTGPQSDFVGTGLQTDERRVRPKPSVGLHAHPVDEAATLEEGLLPVTLDGTTSGGAQHQADVYVPHPLTFALMKLFAFRDRIDDADKEYGRYHALDVYAVIATTTEAEWDQALAWSEHRRSEPTFLEATEIVARQFSSATAPGILRMRESPYWRAELQLDEFLSALDELFPATTGGGV